MKKDRVFYTDTNLFGRDERSLYLESGLSYYVGNIVDLKYAKDKGKAISKINKIKEFAKDRYVSGDRELTTDNMYHIIEDSEDVLITYGDDLLGKKRRTDCSMFCFMFGDILSCISTLFRKKQPTKKDLMLISQNTVNKKCSTVIMSYFNNKQLIDMKYNEIRIIILPRGRTCIEV